MTKNFKKNVAKIIEKVLWLAIKTHRRIPEAWLCRKSRWSLGCLFV